MGTGYTRNDTSNNIADGNIINASDLDGEFDAVESAFNSSTGHTHDGTAAEGGAITVVGPVQDLVVSATEVKPKTTNTLDLGTSGLLYKDAYLQGNMYFRDTALKIVSSADGQLDIDADVELELVAPTVDIDASTAVTIDTATLTITGSANIVGDLDVDNININGNTIISTDTNGNIALTPNGTGEVDISKVDIDSGAIDGVTLGTNSAVTEAQVDNININGNTIISTDTNGDINISPDGTGTVVIDTDLDVDNININGNTISSTDTNGNITLAPDGTGVVNLTDNDKLTFGAGSDLQIYHDGTDSNIAGGTGDLIISTAGTESIYLRDAGGQNLAQFNDNADVKLYYNNNEKLATTNTGIDVTGVITTDGMTTSADINFGDNDKAIFGAGSDLQIYHDGSNSYIHDNGTGDLFIRGSSNVYIQNSGGGSSGAQFVAGGAANINYAGATKLATTATGVDVTSTDSTITISGTRGTGSTHTITTGGANSQNLNVNAATDYYQNATNHIFRDTSATELMRINSSGFVGIGTSSPSRLLSLNSGNASIDFSNGTWTNEIINSAGQMEFRADHTNAVASSVMTFSVDGSEAMRINSDGGVVINNSGGDAQLYLGGTSGTSRMYLARSGLDSNLFNVSNGNLKFGTNNSERMRIDSNGNVGINRTPTYELDVSPSNNANSEIRVIAGSDSGADAVLRLQCTATAGTRDSAIYFGDSANTSIGRITYGHANDDMRFFTNGTECLRIDSSGNLLVSTTDSTPSTNNNASGIAIRNTGQLNASCGSEAPLDINRTSSEGTLVLFRTGGTLQGRMGVTNTYVYLGSDCGIQPRASDIVPTDSVGGLSDNNIDLGDPSARYDDIYATNGTINTSDANEKQQIAALTDAEVTAAKAISGLFKTFKWNSAVEAKGDAARTHAGVIAQDVQAAMTAAGLDAGDYAFFIASTWWETQTEVPAVEAVEAVEAVYEDVIIPAVEEELDEEGNVIVEAQPERTEQRLVSEAIEAVEAVDAYTRTDAYDTAEEAPEGAVERTRLGIRYPELLAFVGAATEQRLANIETRLTALEAN